MTDAGQITVELIAKIDQLSSNLGEAVGVVRTSAGEMKSSLDSAGGSVQLFGENMNDLRHTMLGMTDPIRGVYSGLGEMAEAFAAAFAVEKIAEFAEKMSELGADALHTSMELGLTTEEVSKFNYAAGAMGLQGDAAANGLMRLERAAAEAAGGSKQYARAFDALGVSVTDSSGHVKQMSDLLPEIATRFSQTADGPEKTAIAMAIMGRAGARMIPLLDEGAAGMQEMSDQAERAGVVISGPMAEGMERTEQSMHELGQATQGVGITLYEAFKPAIDVTVEALIGLVEGFNNGVKTGGEFNGLLKLLVVTVDAVVAVILTLCVGFRELYDIMQAGVYAVLGPFEVLGRVIQDVFSGHWDRAVADTKGGLDTIGRMVEDKLHDIVTTGQKYQEEMAKLTSNLVAGGVDTSGGGKGLPKPKLPRLPEIDQSSGGKKKDQARQIADEKLRAAEQEALEEIKIEQDKNHSLLALGQETEAQYAAQAIALEDKIFQVKQQYLTKRAQADAKDKLAQQRDLDQLSLLTIQHEEAVDRIKQQAAEKEQQRHKQELSEALQEDSARLQSAMSELEHEYQMHLLTAGEKAQAERGLTTTIFREELARLDSELSTLTKGTEAWNAAYKQRQKIAEDLSKSVQKIDQQLQTEQMQKWQTLSSSIRGSFNSSLNGMILGTMSWKQALGGIIDGVATAFLNMGEKVLEDWIETQIMKMIISKSTGTATAIAQIQAAAGVAAANTFASVAAIPIVGPALAPGAAAASLATVMSFQSLAFAEQGMLLDRDRLVFAHKDEQILPAHISKGMQDLIANGGKGGGEFNLNYQPNVNAPQHKSLDQMLTDESSTMIAWLNARSRDGSLKVR